MSMVYEGLELVFLHDAGRRDAHEFVTAHGSVQVKVFDVDRLEVGIGSGQDAVEEALDCGYIGGGSTNDSWVFDEVAANGEVDSFGFGLL
jgi:hypothetical protein